MSRIGRRTLLKAGLGLPFIAQHAEGQEDPASIRPRPGDLLVKAGDSTKKPLGPGEIRLGAPPIFAWAMDPKSGTLRSGSRLNQVLVLRLDPAKLDQQTRPRAVNGVVAYTAICTHTGCDVSEWVADAQLLHCPCHGSRFDPKRGGTVVEGEAPRALPALPLRLERGRLLVAGPFSARVAFQSG
jgi:rieske iron-sulfur protein